MAKLGKARALGARERRFESCYPDSQEGENMNKIIYVDVDGVLNFNEKCEGSFDYWVDFDDGHKPGYVRLNKNHGPWLLNLAKETDSELIWATSWLDLANIFIGPQIGLPELPVLNFGPMKFSEYNGAWKSRGMAEKSDGRPFLWFDDDFTIAQYLKYDELDYPYKVQEIGGRTGITRDDIYQAYTWLSEL